MGGISVPERSSLDRLKALDSLPTLEAQLQEAASLCNHGARAEMILRWLLGKWRSSDEARREAACWDLLSSGLRILSTSRIAFLLGSNGFIDVLQTTCSDRDLPEKSMRAIASTLDLLLQLSEKESGTPIKSLLSIQSPSAASICGDWLRHVYHIGKDGEGREETLDPSILDPALKIWFFRRRSDSDDELFNTHCLVPSLLLLRRGHENDETQSNKRKRGQSDTSSAHGCQATLQSLVARHTVVRARAAFFRKRENRNRQPRGRQTVKDQPEIGERLGPLKMAILRENDGQLVTSIPLLLDIALRSVATPTAKNRFSERPWVEAIVAALRGCFANQDRTIQNRTLTGMLEVIHRRGHIISVQNLSAMVRDDAIPVEDPSDADWHLIAQIINLDANVFCDRLLMENLFNAVTASHQRRSGAEDGDLRSLLTDGILTPVMKAHAKSRTLATFIDCWNEQLSMRKNKSAPAIWNGLSQPFADICEEAMTNEQIVSLFDKLVSDVHEKADPLKVSADPETICKLHASFTILTGLLSGIQSDLIIARLQTGLDNLQASLHNLARCEAAKNTQVLPGQLWTLLTKVFDLWFPSWAFRQQTRNDVVEKTLTSALRGAYNAALAQCAAEEASEDAERTAQAAQMFVATLYSCFGRYREFEQCQSLYTEGVEHLSRQGVKALPIVLKFPELLNELQPSARKRMVTDLLTSADEIELSENESHQQELAHLHALFSAASGIPQHDALDDIISACLDHLKIERDPFAAVSVLSGMNMAVLKQEQRVEVLDALLEVQQPEATLSGGKKLQQRLALMTALLRHPCHGSRLLTDAGAIWDVVGLFRKKDIRRKSASTSDVALDSLENLEIFDELVKSFIASLMASRNQKSTRDMLAKFSDQTKKRVKQLCKDKDVVPGTRTASLILLKNVFGTLGNITEDVEADALYSNALAAELKSVNSDPASVRSAGRCPGPLLWIFDALVATPDGFRASPSRMELANTVKMLAYTILDWDDADQPDEDPQDRSRIKVVSFQVACKYAPTAGRKLLPLAEKLLQRDLSAREYMTVVSTFEGAFKADDDEWTVALQGLMTERPQTPAAMILEQKAIKALSDEDLEGSPTGTGYLRGTESFTAYQIFDHTLKQVSENPNFQARKIALQTLVLILKEKPFMINQYGIEQTLATLHNLLSTYPHAAALYTSICVALAALFSAHRSRLQGRFHLLTLLFQALLTTLFTSPLSTPHHARHLTRLLETFCNPQIRPHNKTKTSLLVDENRKAQARAGQYAQYILHHYCSQLLTGASVLREGVREALRPGLWVCIEAIESYNSEGVRVLSSAMNASERAVLRGVYEDWKRFGKWEGL